MSLISVETKAQPIVNVPQFFQTMLPQPLLFAIDTLRRHKWFILVIVALSTAASIANSQKIPPRYAATVDVER